MRGEPDRKCATRSSCASSLHCERKTGRTRQSTGLEEGPKATLLMGQSVAYPVTVSIAEGYVCLRLQPFHVTSPHQASRMSYAVPTQAQLQESEAMSETPDPSADQPQPPQPPNRKLDRRALVKLGANLVAFVPAAVLLAKNFVTPNYVRCSIRYCEPAQSYRGIGGLPDCWDQGYQYNCIDSVIRTELCFCTNTCSNCGYPV